jgi:DNA replication protein DnaC
MNSPAPKTIPTNPSNSLSSQLQQIGLCALPAQLDDFIARATKSRWSPHQILEQLVQAEGAERSRRSLERRLRISGIKSFKPMADFDWSWPAKIERDVIERALSQCRQRLLLRRRIQVQCSEGITTCECYCTGTRLQGLPATEVR